MSNSIICVLLTDAVRIEALFSYVSVFVQNLKQLTRFWICCLFVS